MVVSVVCPHGRTDDNGAHQPHLHLQVRARAAAIEISTRLSGSEGVSDRLVGSGFPGKGTVHPAGGRHYMAGEDDGDISCLIRE